MDRPTTSGSRQAPDPYDQFLEDHCFYRKHTARDPSCLFRVVSEQMYDTQIHHYEVRLECVQYMTHHREIFKEYVDRDFDDYLLDLAKPKTLGTLLELRALSYMYKRNILLFQPFDLGTYFVLRKRYRGTLRIFYTYDYHFDSVYSTEFIQDAAVCQSLCFDMLYRMFFKLPDVDFAVEKMLHPNTFHWGAYHAEFDDNGYLMSVVSADGRIFQLDLPKNTHCILENYRLCNFHCKNFGYGDVNCNNGIVEDDLKASLLPHKQVSCVRQLLDDGITPFPYKVAKSLDPNMYRNIEFDSWNELRKEMRRYIGYKGDDNFQVGAKCHVKLKNSEHELLTGYIQEIAADRRYCVVFVEKLGERHMVPYSALSPLPPQEFKPWGLPYRLQRQMQKFSMARYAQKARIKWKKNKFMELHDSLAGYERIKPGPIFDANYLHMKQYIDLENFHPPVMEYYTYPVIVDASGNTPETDDHPQDSNNPNAVHEAVLRGGGGDSAADRHQAPPSNTNSSQLTTQATQQQQLTSEQQNVVIGGGGEPAADRYEPIHYAQAVLDSGAPGSLSYGFEYHQASQGAMPPHFYGQHQMYMDDMYGYPGPHLFPAEYNGAYYYMPFSPFNPNFALMHSSPPPPYPFAPGVTSPPVYLPSTPLSAVGPPLLQTVTEPQNCPSQNTGVSSGNNRRTSVASSTGNGSGVLPPYSAIPTQRNTTPTAPARPLELPLCPQHHPPIMSRHDRPVIPPPSHSICTPGELSVTTNMQQSFGRVNLDARRSTRVNGQDLPSDIPTLRYFYNLGIEYHNRMITRNNRNSRNREDTPFNSGVLRSNSSHISPTLGEQVSQMHGMRLSDVPIRNSAGRSDMNYNSGQQQQNRTSTGSLPITSQVPAGNTNRSPPSNTLSRNQASNNTNPVRSSASMTSPITGLDPPSLLPTRQTNYSPSSRQIPFPQRDYALFVPADMSHNHIENGSVKNDGEYIYDYNTDVVNTSMPPPGTPKSLGVGISSPTPPHAMPSYVTGTPLTTTVMPMAETMEMMPFIHAGPPPSHINDMVSAGGGIFMSMPPPAPPTYTIYTHLPPPTAIYNAGSVAMPMAMSTAAGGGLIYTTPTHMHKEHLMEGHTPLTLNDESITAVPGVKNTPNHRNKCSYNNKTGGSAKSTGSVASTNGSTANNHRMQTSKRSNNSHKRSNSTSSSSPPLAPPPTSRSSSRGSSKSAQYNNNKNRAHQPTAPFAPPSQCNVQTPSTPTTSFNNCNNSSSTSNNSFAVNAAKKSTLDLNDNMVVDKNNDINSNNISAYDNNCAGSGSGAGSHMLAGGVTSAPTFAACLGYSIPTSSVAMAAPPPPSLQHQTIYYTPSPQQQLPPPAVAGAPPQPTQAATMMPPPPQQNPFWCMPPLLPPSIGHNNNNNNNQSIGHSRTVNDNQRGCGGGGNIGGLSSSMQPANFPGLSVGTTYAHLNNSVKNMNYANAPNYSVPYLNGTNDGNQATGSGAADGIANGNNDSRNISNANAAAADNAARNRMHAARRKDPPTQMGNVNREPGVGL